jgi:uncharacterized membrane protein YbhN (UPF0104 family)
VESLRSFANAVEAFVEQVAAVDPWYLAGALGLSLLNLVLRSRAWRNIVLAAYPRSRLRHRTAFGAYVAGVGVNAAVPARVGDLVKVFLVHRRVPGSSYPTLAATLLAETLVDMVLATGLFLWALQAGVLPGLPRIPRLPAFELSWVVQHPYVSVAVAGALLMLLLLALRRVRAFWARFRMGLVILRTPGAYLGRVASYQVLGWVCRLAAAFFFLEAFHVPGSLEAAALVQVASSVGSLLPATPGGLGPTQALLVVLFAGTASSADVLAFSVGMEASLLAMNVTLALVALTAMSGRLRVRDLLTQARSTRGASEAG